MVRKKGPGPVRPADNDLVTPAEAGVLLGCSKRAVLYHLAAGRIPGRKLGKRWIILRSAVERILDEARSGAGLGIEDVV